MGCGASKGGKSNSSATDKNKTDKGNTSDTESYTLISFKDIVLDDLWDTPREERDEWRSLLQRARDIRITPKSDHDPTIVQQALLGDFSVDFSQYSKSGRIVIFISSTFTDTELERNSLMLDVFPFLRILCRELDLEFGSVDMRWGVREDTTLSHGTTSMCLTQIKRCMDTSTGPAFVLIQGNKYGYRPLRTEIEKEEYETIYGHLKKQGQDVTHMDTWYRLDNNVLPPSYILLPRTPGDGDIWWTAFEAMQVLFRLGAQCHEQTEKQEPYHRSVTEDEIHLGLLNNDKNADQSYYFVRKFAGLGMTPDKAFFDVKPDNGAEVDPECQSRLQGVRARIEATLPADNVHHFQHNVAIVEGSKEKGETSIGPAQKEDFSDSLKTFADVFCRKISEGILKCYQDKLHVNFDPVFNEASQHHTTAKMKGELVIGRDSILEHVQGYLKQMTGEARRCLTLHGVSGCGKTSVMARIALTARDALNGTARENGVVVVRFLGTTAESTSARSVMLSAGAQIQRAFGIAVTDPLPAMYGDVIDWFHKTVLPLATQDRPITLILDSLDQMNDEDNGRRLKWLPGVNDDLPDYVTCVVSTLPDLGPSFAVLQGALQTGDRWSNNVVPVPLLTVVDGPIISRALLSRQGRTLQPEQEKRLLSIFEETPSPLLLKLACQQALEWRSWHTEEETTIPRTIPALIEEIFLDLERIFGKVFVERSLGYITSSRRGLSTGELEDILSIDDTVLDDVYEWWTPPQRRIPPLLWLRVRNALGDYIVERGSGGRSVMQWYHRQFWEAAERRYLSDDKHRRETHRLIAEYFDGKYAQGKDYTTKNGEVVVQANRGIDTQPLILSQSEDTVVWNRRKLDELLYHYTRAHDQEALERLCTDLSFIRAKFSAGQGSDLLSLIRQAQEICTTPSSQVTQFARFVGAQFSILSAEPNSVYQVASQESDASPIYQHYQRHVQDGGSTGKLAVVTEIDKPSYTNPCVMTLTGHKGSVRCVSISPKGDLFVSGSEDGTVRIWDARSGEELVSVGAPLISGKVYPKAPSPAFGEKPVKFSPLGNHVAVGTEDGDVIVIDIMGNEVWSARQAHPNHVIALGYSFDGKLIASGCRGGVLTIFDAAAGTVKHKVSIGVEVSGLSFSRDDQFVLLGTRHQGLRRVEVASGSIAQSITGVKGMFLTVKPSPDGTLTAAGSDGSSLHLVDWQAGTVQRLGGHTAWVWQVDWSPDGRYIATASSDRSAKIWDTQNMKPLVTLRGHDHRVSHLQFAPDSRTILTCSLDRTLRVWDVQLAIEGKDNAPAAGGGHFKFYTASRDRQVYCYSQSWESTATILTAASGDKGVTTPSLGSLASAAVNDSNHTLVTRCYGEKVHNGSGTPQAMIHPLPGSTLDAAITIPTSGRCTCLAVSPDGGYLALGYLDGQVALHNANTGSQVGIITAYRDDNTSITASTLLWASTPVSITRVVFDSTSHHVIVSLKSGLKMFKVEDVLASQNAHPVLDVATLYPSSISSLVLVPEMAKGQVPADLITGHSDGSIVAWSGLQQGKLSEVLRVERAHPAGTVSGLFFPPIPEGAVGADPPTLLASLSATDKSVRTWKLCDSLAPHAVFYGPIRCALFENADVIRVALATGEVKRLSIPH